MQSKLSDKPSTKPVSTVGTWKITPDMFGHYRIARNNDEVKHECAIFLRKHEFRDLIKALKEYLYE